MPFAAATYQFHLDFGPEVYFDKAGDLDDESNRCNKLRSDIEKAIYALPFERPS